MHDQVTSLKLLKTKPQRLRSLGFNELWLQRQIYDDPSLLGLGDVEVVQREKIQPTGGRLDFLLADFENQARFEVEVMLGAVDESHIIRTIEYWDIERQRNPHLQHTAVIVAEEITSRFFNVIRLFNRAVPIMAIQLSAFRLDGNVVLQFIRVLDSADFGTGIDDADGVDGQPTNRGYWETKSKPLLEIVDAFTSMIPSSDIEPRVVYNKGHVALATDGYNFCWFYPRKLTWQCAVVIKVGADARQEIIADLEKVGLQARPYGKAGVAFNVKLPDVAEHRETIAEVLRIGDALSRR